MDREDRSVERSELGIGADLKKRVVARIIDSFLIGMVIIYAIPLAGFTDEFTMTVLSVATVMAYFTLMESFNGRTLGKMVLGLRTVGPSGGNPSLEMAFRRNVWYLLGILPYVGSLAEIAAVIYIAVTIGRSPTNTGWHDNFAPGTRVVPVGARR
ncbi:MAG: RDD family protein [Actinomycetota bacterium]|nr:RDD family protein [Actinomycetota bacterium]